MTITLHLDFLVIRAFAIFGVCSKMLGTKRELYIRVFLRKGRLRERGGNGSAVFFGLSYALGVEGK